MLFDATSVPTNRSGVGRYVDGLLAELRGGALAIACQQRDTNHYRQLAPHATILPQSIRLESAPVRFLWEQFCLPALARRCRASVIHSPHYTIPLLTRRARVVTLHDATFFSDPGVHTAVKGVFFRVWTRVSVRFARVLIAPSQATATEVARYAGGSGKFVIAHHGVDFDTFHQPTVAEIDSVTSRYELGGPGWIIFLGTLEPRKNLSALVRAYGLLVRECQRTGRPLPPLVLAGGRGWDTTLEAEIGRIQEPGRVAMLGFVPASDIRALLGGAALMIYPSLGEGFGLPVLEAMACGVPVLTTRRLALPEVGGDAVTYTETDDASIAAAISGLLDAPDMRADLSAAGLERARTFTWLACARAHEGAYRAANAQHPSGPRA